MTAAPTDGQAATSILAEFRPALRIYVQGAGGEPLALRSLLAAHPGALAGVDLTSCLLPGINDFDYAALDPAARLTVFMLSPALRDSFAAGRVILRPMAYSQIAAAFESEPAFDLAVFQVAPPDADGLCSLGPCADFAPIVWPRAARRLGLINPAVPRTVRGPAIPLAALDVAVELPGPLVGGAPADVGPLLETIAGAVASLVPDRAAIQTGIGGAPAAALAHMADHRGLVIRSGLVTEGYRRLSEAGALDPAAEHVTGLAWGAPDFLAWACRELIFADARRTHGPAALAQTERFYAINSALEVDLFGQANIEWRGGRLVSGLGGAPDFARAARACPDGRAILALRASAGPASRIVPRLAAPTVSLSRNDTDLVVTEHGVADLRGASLDGRAEALIAIAAPEHRVELARAWTLMRASL